MTLRTAAICWKQIISLSVTLLLLTVSSPFCAASGGGAQKAVSEAKKGVVRIFCEGEEPSEEGRHYSVSYMSTGSGFYIGDTDGEQYFITNHHVVSEDDGADCDEVYILLEDGAVTEVYDSYGDYVDCIRNNEDAMVPCEIVYKTDGYPDFAILKTKKPIQGLIPLRLSRASDIRDGTAVYALGYPGSADDIQMQIGEDEITIDLPAGWKSSTLTDGIVSRSTEAGFAQNTWAIQHTASINHGNSGGPLVTSDGAVIGINTYGMNEHGLAIFIEYAVQKLDELSIHYSLYQDWSVLFLPGAVLGLMAVLLILFILISKKRSAKPLHPDPGLYRLQSVSGVFAPKRFPIRNPTRIGRDPGRNDLVYPPTASKISGVHCQLLFEDGRLYLEDLNSKNGTYRDGVKLPVMQKIPLEIGSIFSLGDSSESFRVAISSRKR